MWDGGRSTVLVCRMPVGEWRESKEHPSTAQSGHQLSCCLLSLHFLWGNQRTSTVHSLVGRRIAVTWIPHCVILGNAQCANHLKRHSPGPLPPSFFLEKPPTIPNTAFDATRQAAGKT